jgi:hypothetical protein
LELQQKLFPLDGIGKEYSLKQENPIGSKIQTSTARAREHLPGDCTRAAVVAFPKGLSSLQKPYGLAIALIESHNKLFTNSEPSILLLRRGGDFVCNSEKKIHVRS